jgi:hypothetical protein
MEQETKPFYNVQNILAILDEKQQLVLQEVKAELIKQSIQLSEEIVAWFVLSKKKPSKVLHSLTQYLLWCARLDFGTLSWEHVEYLLRQQVLQLSTKPAKDGSAIVYLNSLKLEPKFAGGRLLIATLWLVAHFLLCKTNALTDKITMCGQMCDVGWGKFYPDIQKPLLESMQTVLPIRYTRQLLVDTPFVFWMIYEIFSLWLSEKFKQRIVVCESKDLPKYIDKEEILTIFKGGKKELDTDQFVNDVKLFFELEFKPTVQSFLADNPQFQEESFTNALWEPSKDFNRLIERNRKRGKEDEKK